MTAPLSLRARAGADLLTLRVRDADDLAQQLNMQNVNAIVYALTRTILPHAERPQTRAPYASAHGMTVGSGVAGEFEEAAAKLQTLLIDAYAPTLPGEEPQDRTAEIEEARARALKRAGQVGGLLTWQEPLEHRYVPRAQRRHARMVEARQRDLNAKDPAPITYEVTIPAVSWTMPDGSTYGDTSHRYLLDTSTLPMEVQRDIRRFRHSQQAAPPYWYCRSRARYYARSGYPEAFKALLDGLVQTPPLAYP